MLHTPNGLTILLTRLAPEAALWCLEPTVARCLEGLLHGDHLGLLPGSGSDMNDARPYQPDQDDIRMMGWVVTARATVPRVRDTMTDRGLEVWGLLSVTLSISWGVEGIIKRDLNITAVATIGFLSQRMGDRFDGFMMLLDYIKRLSVRSSRIALYGMLWQMLTEPIVPDNAPGDLELVNGIKQMVCSQRHHGTWVAVPDFLTLGEAGLDPDRPPAWERAIRRLVVRNQMLCVKVADRHELELPDVGEMLARDPKASFLCYTNTSDPAARQRMDDASRAQRERIKVALRRMGMEHTQLHTGHDWVSDTARFVLDYRWIANTLHASLQGVSR